MPGAMRASRPGSGPIANGKSVITIRKNKIGLTISARRRNANLRSLKKTAGEKCRIWKKQLKNTVYPPVVGGPGGNDSVFSNGLFN